MDSEAQIKNKNLEIMRIDLAKLKKVEQEYRTSDVLGGIAVNTLQQMIDIVMAADGNVADYLSSPSYVTAWSTLKNLGVIVDDTEKPVTQLNS